MKRVFLITGNPGVGKTTILTKTVELLKSKNHSVGGMISREVREKGTRVGFEILDLETNKRGWLANANQKTGPQVGKYRVNLTDLETIAAKAISEAVENSEIVAIDEIGPIELFSEEFKKAVKKALESKKTVIAVAHARANDKILREAKSREDAEIFIVTTENRDSLSEKIAAKVNADLAEA